MFTYRRVEFPTSGAKRRTIHARERRSSRSPEVQSLTAVAPFSVRQGGQRNRKMAKRPLEGTITGSPPTRDVDEVAVAAGKGVAVDGDVIYVADAHEGLQVLSLAPATAALRIRLSWIGGPPPWLLELGDPDGIAWPEETLTAMRVEQSTDLMDWFVLNQEHLWTNGHVRVAVPGFPEPSFRFYRAVYRLP